jgi:hypothetical protein
MLTSAEVAIPSVWFIYPETRGRSLEEINLLFASPSILVSANEKEYQRMVQEAGGNTAVAERRLLDEVDASTREGKAEARTPSASSTGEKGSTSGVAIHNIPKV